MKLTFHPQQTMKRLPAILFLLIALSFPSFGEQKTARERDNSLIERLDKMTFGKTTIPFSQHITSDIFTLDDRALWTTNTIAIQHGSLACYQEQVQDNSKVLWIVDPQGKHVATLTCNHYTSDAALIKGLAHEIRMALEGKSLDGTLLYSNPIPPRPIAYDFKKSRTGICLLYFGTPSMCSYAVFGRTTVQITRQLSTWNPEYDAQIIGIINDLQENPNEHQAQIHIEQITESKKQEQLNQRKEQRLVVILQHPLSPHLYTREIDHRISTYNQYIKITDKQGNILESFAYYHENSKAEVLHAIQKSIKMYTSQYASSIHLKTRIGEETHRHFSIITWDTNPIGIRIKNRAFILDDPISKATIHSRLFYKKLAHLILKQTASSCRNIRFPLRHPDPSNQSSRVQNTSSRPV